jgi:hypothetical protein
LRLISASLLLALLDAVSLLTFILCIALVLLTPFPICDVTVTAGFPLSGNCIGFDSLLPECLAEFARILELTVLALPLADVTGNEDLRPLGWDFVFSLASSAGEFAKEVLHSPPGLGETSGDLLPFNTGKRGVSWPSLLLNNFPSSYLPYSEADLESFVGFCTTLAADNLVGESWTPFWCCGKEVTSVQNDGCGAADAEVHVTTVGNIPWLPALSLVTDTADDLVLFKDEFTKYNCSMVAGGVVDPLSQTKNLSPNCNDSPGRLLETDAIVNTGDSLFIALIACLQVAGSLQVVVDQKIL